MAKFLNDYSSKMNRASSEKLRELAKTFRDAIALADKALDGRAFRPIRSMNAAVFESAMVGIAVRLSRRPPPTPEAIAGAYDALLLQTDYRKGWERATADEENVKSRMNAAVRAFDAI